MKQCRRFNKIIADNSAKTFHAQTVTSLIKLQKKNTIKFLLETPFSTLLI